MKQTLQAMLIALVAIMMPIGAWAQEEESTVEAVWGASAEELTESGTFQDAINAAAAENSTVGYIQLQSDVTSADSYFIVAGTFTLDLNGCTLMSDFHALIFQNEGTNVFITDTSEGETGKVVAGGEGNFALYIESGANITITGGNYESNHDVVTIKANSFATINGGTFKIKTTTDVITNEGTLSITGGSFEGDDITTSVYIGTFSVNTTITGGTFANGSYGMIRYNGGKLDLSGYHATETEGTTPLTDISIYCGASNVAVNATTIALPSGHCFFDSEEQAVVTLANDGKYSIGTEPENKYTISYAANGGAGTMVEGLSYGGDYVLPECTFTAPDGMMFKAWQVGETEYQPGDVIGVPENTTVTAVWRDYVPQIVLELTDAFGDGWNGAAITVNKDGEEMATVTIENGQTATFKYDYDSACEYTFFWTKGSYNEECSFVVKIEDEVVHVASTDDCETYEDGQLIHTIELKVIVVDAITIADGELTEYSNNKQASVGTLTYTRTLPNLTWNALYVPFEIPVSDLSEKYDVAYINDVHSYDTDGNGSIDAMDMEVIKIMSGTLNANYPYLIRAKNESAKAMNIVLTDATLYKTETNGVSCSSVFMEFNVYGTYEQMKHEDYPDVLAIGGDGSWHKLAENTILNPFRLYLEMNDLDGSPVKVEESAASKIRIKVWGEDSNTTGIEENCELGIMNSEMEVYDLQGRRVKNPTKGLYIVNGKKVVKN